MKGFSPSRERAVAGRTLKGPWATGLLGGVLWVLLTGMPAPASGAEPVDTAPVIELQVFKLATCTCCRPWIKYMEANGFRVRVTDVNDMEPIHRRFGTPTALRGCHTAVIDGYVFEGHVTADEVRDVLNKRPKIKGLYVAGMPKGSPGMEAPEVERYEVVAVDAAGATSVVAVHNPEAKTTAAPMGPPPSPPNLVPPAE